MYQALHSVSLTLQQFLDSEIKADQLDESRMVDLELAPNDASVHAARLIHGSAPNTGAMSRSAFTVRYFPTNVKFHPEAHEYFKQNFQIYLARGRDRAGNSWSDPSRSYKPAGTIA